MIVNGVWLEDVLSDLRKNGSKEFVKFVLEGCREDDILPYDLATDALDQGMYDADDLLGILLERSCDKGESITDVAISILQDDIANYIRHDLLYHSHMVVILDRVWLFMDGALASYELEDMASYRFANGIFSNREDCTTTETMYVYTIDREYSEYIYIPTGNVVLTLKEELLIEY